MTMLGAIATTVISLLITAGLPTFRQSMYDPAVSDGKILVGVPGSSDAVRDALTASGATVVKVVDL